MCTFSQVIFFFGIVIVANASADSESKTMDISRSQKFEVIEEPGRAQRVLVEDGSEAELKVSYSDLVEAKIPIKISENLCYPNAPSPSCQWITRLTKAKVGFYWTKHRDASRIGQLVRMDNLEVVDELITTTFYSGPYRDFLGLERGGGPHSNLDQLMCDDFSWLIDPSTAAAKTEHELIMWSGEGMSQNEETAANENRQTEVFYNIRLKARDQYFTVHSALQRASSWFISQGPAQFESSMLVQKNSSGENCQISLSSSLGNYQAAFLQTVYAKTGTPLPSPHVRLQDFGRFRFLGKVSSANFK